MHNRRRILGHGPTQSSRQRREGVIVFGDMSSGSGSRPLTPVSSDTDDSERPRKQRRGGRGVATVRLLQTPEDRGGRPTPTVSSEHQAEVPTAPIYGSEWCEKAPPIGSKLMYAPGAAPETVVSAFLTRLDGLSKQLSSFPLAPFAKELALVQLTAARGNTSAAVTATMAALPKVSSTYYPGLKHGVTHDEHCRFVRALGEHGKDFTAMARAFPNRTRAELVWIYYARHKQLRLQNGCIDSALVLDNGAPDILKKCPLSASRAILMLHTVARSGDDGFAIDQRLIKQLLSLRTRAVALGKRRRDGENGRRSTRTRPT